MGFELDFDEWYLTVDANVLQNDLTWIYNASQKHESTLFHT